MGRSVSTGLLGGEEQETAAQRAGGLWVSGDCALRDQSHLSLSLSLGMLRQALTFSLLLLLLGSQDQGKEVQRGAGDCRLSSGLWSSGVCCSHGHQGVTLISLAILGKVPEGESP